MIHILKITKRFAIAPHGISIILCDSLLQGSHNDQFIATQAPVEKTVRDFWRMVIERGTVAIVSLVEINEVIIASYNSHKIRQIFFHFSFVIC